MDMNVRLQVSVVALFVCDNEVLLLHQMTPPEPDLWDLPGGRLEPAEDLISGLRREVYEEVGLTEFEIGRILTISEAFYREEENQKLHKLNLVYECQTDTKPTRFHTLDEQEIGPNGICWLPVGDLKREFCTTRVWQALQAAKLIQ
jgi:ADP-ribose pyrophosphatase YjhB (NUDIX family)